MNQLSAWVPALCMMLVSLISYVDRNTLAILAPTIRREAGLSNEDYGYIISAFSFAYMVGNPIWGRWLDRIGVRVGMLAAVSFWTVASAAHAAASGFWSFGVARAALGFGEGGDVPRRAAHGDADAAA
jgi:ACS family hexuronate transporter-like MFS transporter